MGLNKLALKTEAIMKAFNIVFSRGKHRVIDNIGHAISHRNCYICKQSSIDLICTYCIKDTSLPIFPSPGHNLLDHSLVLNNLVEPAYNDLHAIGEYEGVLVGLINQLKFGAKPIAADVLACFFHQYLSSRLELNQALPDLLIPIPLSKLRYLKREYNQARLLTQRLGQKFDVPICDALVRRRHTKQQSSLSREQRLTNVESAFSLQAPHHQALSNIDSVAIVDDVITTGATINEACKAIQMEYPDLIVSAWCMAIATR